MLDDAIPGASEPLPHCMWCSAELPSDQETVCPSCGATLIGEPDSPVPGVTAIDAEAIVRAARATKPRQRSRLLSWISGDYEVEEKPAPPASLSPPPLAVRREMLRLELEAQVANLQAEAGAMAAEEAVEAGTTIAETDIGAALAAVTRATHSEAEAGATDAAGPAATEPVSEATPDDNPSSTPATAEAKPDEALPPA
jgi:hypothetical protein